MLVSAFVSANNQSTYPDYLWYDDFDGAIDEYNHSSGCYIDSGKLFNCTYLFTDGLYSIPSGTPFSWAVEFKMPVNEFRSLYMELHRDGQFFNRNEGGVLFMRTVIGGSFDYVAYNLDSYLTTTFQLLNFDPPVNQTYEVCQDYESNKNRITGNLTTSTNSNAGYYNFGTATEIGLRPHSEFQINNFRVWAGLCSDEPRTRPYVYAVYPQEATEIISINSISYNVTDYNNVSVNCDIYIDGQYNQSDIAVSYMENMVLVNNLPSGVHTYQVNCTDGTTEQTTGLITFSIAPAPLITGYVASYNEGDIAEATISFLAQFLIVVGSFVTALVAIAGLNYILMKVK